MVAIRVWPAHAQFDVVDTEIEAGVIELEAVGSVEWGYETIGDDDEAPLRQGHELVVGYGVTDYWKPEFVLELEQLRDEELEATGLGFENTLSLPLEAGPLRAGIFVAYGASLSGEDVHAVEFGPIIQFELGPTISTANPFFEKQFGDDRDEGVTFSYAWQTAAEIADQLAVGLEAFGGIDDFAGSAPNLSEQEHRIGPVATYGLEFGETPVGIDVGFLFGLTDATADAAFKWKLALEL